jgi:hypothetical protein
MSVIAPRRMFAGGDLRRTGGRLFKAAPASAKARAKRGGKICLWTSLPPPTARGSGGETRRRSGLFMGKITTNAPAHG